MIDFFYSDPHFGHANVIRYDERPFRDVEHMTRELVSRYNSVVAPDHTVLWVGDCFFAKLEQSVEIMRSLNGRKMLVRGNHDRSNGKMLGLGFELVADKMTLLVAGVTTEVQHHPPQYSREKASIHGHTHQKDAVHGRNVCVSVTAWDYFPVSYGAVSDLVWRMKQTGMF